MLGLLPRSQALGLAAFVAVVAPNLGCGQTACFQWSTNEGACPDHNQARMFFGNCNDIQSIDDDGKFANNLCCYSVTKASGRLNGIDCTGNVGVGVGPTTVVGTVGPSVASTVSSGPNNQCDFSGFCGDTTHGCISCALNGICAPELQDCAMSQECTKYQDCVAKCPAPQMPSCVTTCAMQHQSGAQTYDAIVDCAICQACPSDCYAMAQSCPGHPSTSSSGGGGVGGSSSSGMGGAGGK